jgi:glycine/serine hydroxymethyltransferase
MRGMDEEDFRTIGRVMVDALGDSPDLGALRATVERLCAEHPLYRGFRGWTTYVA